MLKTLEKEKPITIGAAQALLVATYCGLIATFFNLMSKTKPQAGFFGMFVILVIFVFSAAVTGTLVFGYPSYLGLVRHKLKEALEILFFTLAFSLLIILLGVLVILLAF